jgi:transposase
LARHESQEAAMAHVADHLSIGELEDRYRSCADACSARHYQTIWLLAQGHTIAAVSETTSFVPRWIEELLARYNALGPKALGDLRRHNGAQPSVLKPDLLAKLKRRLREPPPDGGVWTSGKVASWMAQQLGLATLAPQRGWEALQAIGWSIQSPRPKNPKSATPEQEAAFKKTSPPRSPKKSTNIPTSRSRSGRPMSIGSA